MWVLAAMLDHERGFVLSGTSQRTHLRYWQNKILKINDNISERFVYLIRLYAPPVKKRPDDRIHDVADDQDRRGFRPIGVTIQDCVQ